MVKSYVPKLVKDFRCGIWTKENMRICVVFILKLQVLNGYLPSSLNRVQLVVQIRLNWKLIMN